MNSSGIQITKLLNEGEYGFNFAWKTGKSATAATIPKHINHVGTFMQQ
jgi:hypothetical protein